MKSTKSKITLSARTIGTLLGYNKRNTPWKHFVEKSTKSYSTTSIQAINHGNKYEREAIHMYSLVTGRNVSLVNTLFYHKEYKWLTGAVDGIVDLGNNNKAILEVKCPYVKQFPNPNQKDWGIDDFYWSQVQIYMEILGIDKTHFVEYYRKEPALAEEETCGQSYLLRWKNIKRDRAWFRDNLPVIERYYKEITYFTENGIEKHPIYDAMKKWERMDKWEEPKVYWSSNL